MERLDNQMSLFIYLFLISLNKRNLKLSCCSTQVTSFPLGSLHLTLVETLSLRSAEREDGIFKISLLRLKHVVSVCSVPDPMCTSVCNCVCVFVWGGFHLFLSRKELPADREWDGFTVFIRSDVRTIEDKGSTQDWRLLE